jgi:predicted LPLAT superfamily acyltransferase
MNQDWKSLPERGTGFWLRTIVWLALNFGRKAAGTLLYPISAFFLLLSRRPRQASLDYLTRIEEKPANWMDTFHHYHTFAETILDRVFVFAGRADFLDIDVRGFDLLEAQSL